MKGENLKWIDDYVPKYWEGHSNILVRYWVYLSRGLDFVNQGRYLILGILGIYAVLKLANPIWLVVMFVVCTPVLILLGRWNLYKVAQSQEFIVTTRGTVTGYGSYNLAVKNVELQEQILEALHKLNAHHTDPQA